MGHRSHVRAQLRLELESSTRAALLIPLTRFLRTIDRFYNSHISLFHTGARAKFLLLHNPDPASPSIAHLFPFRQAPGLASAADPSSKNPGLGVGRPSYSSRSTSNFSTASTLAASSNGPASPSRRQVAHSVAHNPTSPQAEEATRQFFADVYESWIKAVMSPFYVLDMPVQSPVFRQRVAGAARKYL